MTGDGSGHARMAALKGANLALRFLMRSYARVERLYRINDICDNSQDLQQQARGKSHEYDTHSIRTNQST